MRGQSFVREQSALAANEQFSHASCARGFIRRKVRSLHAGAQDVLVVQLATVEHPVVGRCRTVVSVDHSAELDKALGRRVAGVKILLYDYCTVVSALLLDIVGGEGGKVESFEKSDRQEFVTTRAT